MNMITRLLLFAALVALGLAGGAAAATAGAAPCTPGNQTYSHYYGPPGSATVTRTTASHPGGCQIIWAEAESQGGHFYWSGHIAGVLAATAQICMSCGDPNTRLGTAWRWKEANSPGAACYRQEFYPVLASGYSKRACPSSRARTMAVLGGHLSRAAARRIADGRAQPQAVLICTLHGHPQPWCGSVVDPFKLGDVMRNGYESTALPLFWHNTGETPYGMSIGYWELSTGANPRVLGAAGTAANPDCAHIVIKSSSSDFGTTTGWLFSMTTPAQWFATRACQNGGPWSSAPPKTVWGTDTALAGPWGADYDRTQPPPGSLIQFTTVLDPNHRQARAHTVLTAARRRTCSTGHTTSVVGPSGQTLEWAIVSLDGADNPPGCEQVLVRVLSTGGHTTRSGLIRNPGSAQAWVKDGTQVAQAWTEKQPNGNPGARQCRKIYPVVQVNFWPCAG